MKTAIKIGKKKNCYGNGGETGDIKLSEKEKEKVRSSGNPTETTREIVGIKPSSYHQGTEGWKRAQEANNNAIKKNNSTVTPARNTATPNADANASKKIQDAKIKSTDSNAKNTNYADSDDVKEKARIQANLKNADGTKGTNALTSRENVEYAKGGLVNKFKKKSLARS